MKKPLFEVGEDVIIQSQDFPEASGECAVVEKIVGPGEKYVDRLSGNVFRNGSGKYAYLLSNKVPHPDGSGDEALWEESALRKKHKPSELSFKELVSSLKTPIKA